MTSTEAWIIISMLFDKLGSSNSLLKNKAKALVRQAFQVCERSLVMQLVSEIIPVTKSLKSVAPCLEEVCALLEKDGATGVSERVFKQLFKNAEHSDLSIRKATLLLIEKTYETKCLSEE